ncbi:MAG: dienelactone hydrolase family protein, partial [Methylococcaceae bacterium]|nr:dienelactone hydrolase family protein [Methylococcaceae bacterium]
MIKIIMLFMVFSISVANTVNAEIRSEVINYQIAGQPFQGYLSYDDAITGKRPGVLVVHEWWGHNAYARKRADMLAAMGYTAFALDMYGKGKLAEHPEDAKKFMQATLADMNIAEARFNAAKQFLQKHPSVESNQVAAIGYCFGGGVVLH